MYRGLLVHCRVPERIEFLQDHLIGFDEGTGGEVRDGGGEVRDGGGEVREGGEEAREGGGEVREGGAVREDAGR